LRQTDNGQGKSKQLETKFYYAPRPIHGSGKLWQQARGNELLQEPQPATLRAQKERN
jgi:hypothetical protein